MRLANVCEFTPSFLWIYPLLWSIISITLHKNQTNRPAIQKARVNPKQQPNDLAAMPTPQLKSMGICVTKIGTHYPVHHFHHKNGVNMTFSAPLAENQHASPPFFKYEFR
jgi:hypothetical protein